MKDRSELLNLISELLANRLGSELVGRDERGTIIVAGHSQAFMVDLVTIAGSDEAEPHSFGKRLIVERQR